MHEPLAPLPRRCLLSCWSWCCAMAMMMTRLRPSSSKQGRKLRQLQRIHLHENAAIIRHECWRKRSEEHRRLGQWRNGLSWKGPYSRGSLHLELCSSGFHCKVKKIHCNRKNTYNLGQWKTGGDECSPSSCNFWLWTCMQAGISWFLVFITLRLWISAEKTFGF